MEENKPVKGYKVFNPDWTCREFQYEVGKTYELEGYPRPCEYGFHFCEEVADCFRFYDFDPRNKVAEVLAHGVVLNNGEKSCTNKIQIVREISWEEMLTLANEGVGNTGLRNAGNQNIGNHNAGNRNIGEGNTGNQNIGSWNAGNRNTGDLNTGDLNTGNWNIGEGNTGNQNIGSWNAGNRNTGDLNTGNWNTGNWNTGDLNTGNWNTGDGNIGNWNIGSRNTGNWNTGDWNKCDFSSGCFCTTASFFMFNRPAEITLSEWRNSDAFRILQQAPGSRPYWVDISAMTPDEKEKHREAATTGGCLRMVDETDQRQDWWDNLSEDKKASVLNLPNFDPEIFKEVTGIDTTI